MPREYRPTGRPQGDPVLIEEAAALLKGAKRPVIVAGKPRPVLGGRRSSYRPLPSPGGIPVFYRGAGEGTAGRRASAMFRLCRRSAQSHGAALSGSRRRSVAWQAYGPPLPLRRDLRGRRENHPGRPFAGRDRQEPGRRGGNTGGLGSRHGATNGGYRRSQRRHSRLGQPIEAGPEHNWGPRAPLQSHCGGTPAPAGRLHQPGTALGTTTR